MSLMIRYDRDEKVLRSTGETPGIVTMMVGHPEHGTTLAVDPHVQPPPMEGRSGLQIDVSVRRSKEVDGLCPITPADAIRGAKGAEEGAILWRIAAGSLAAVVDAYAPTAKLESIQQALDFTFALRDALSDRFD